MKPTIKWEGKIGNIFEVERAKTLNELYEKLVSKEVISTINFDPREKYIIERAGFNYDQVMSMIDERMESNSGDFGLEFERWMKENGVSDELTDREYMSLIENNTDAYEQRFFDEYDTELEFDENGMIPLTRQIREKVEMVYETTGNSAPVYEVVSDKIVEMERSKIDSYFDFSEFLREHFTKSEYPDEGKVTVMVDRYRANADIATEWPLNSDEEEFDMAEIKAKIAAKENMVTEDKNLESALSSPNTPKMKL